MPVNTESLASAADLVARYDARRIADLVKDHGVRVDPTTITVANSPANLIVVAALLDATAEIEAAARVAARYTHAQLFGDATTTPATPGSTLAKRLCCDLAFAYLTGRRGYAESQQGSLTPRANEAKAMLQALREGQRLLDIYGLDANNQIIRIEDHAQAGLPKRVNLDLYDPNLLTTQMHRFFGNRLYGC